MQKIRTIRGIAAYIENHSNWSASTVRHVIEALGFDLDAGDAGLAELSGNLADCAQYGADGGFSGFVYYSETIAFFKANRRDIVRNLESMAEELGEEVFEMVKNFGVFSHSTPPASGEIGKALWDSGKIHEGLTSLYNVFSWFALEEIARVWSDYLYENPAYRAELSA
jgi:hypothetical protein